MASHCCKVYTTEEQYVGDHVTGRAQCRAKARWKAWRARHPGSPYIVKCSICSGQESRIFSKAWNLKKRDEEVSDVSYKEMIKEV